MKLTEFLQSIKKKEVLLEDGKFAGAKLTQKSARKLQKWIEDNDIGNAVPSSEFHVTILYSDKVDFLWDAKKYPGGLKIDPHTYEFDLFGEDKNILVLKFNSPELAARHYKAREKYGVDWKFDEYKPHITLSYKIKDLDMSDLDPPGFPIYFSHEYFKDNDEEYVKKLKGNVTEAKIEKLETLRGFEIISYVNPHYYDMQIMLRDSKDRTLRGIVAMVNGVEIFYVWDGYFMAHITAERQLGIDDAHLIGEYFFTPSIHGIDVEDRLGRHDHIPRSVKRAITPPITEAKTEVVSTKNGQQIVVIKNPNHEQLLKQIDASQYKQVRGIVDTKGVLYIWDAYMATHYNMRILLGIDMMKVLENYIFDMSAITNKLEVYPKIAEWTKAIFHAMDDNNTENNLTEVKIIQTPGDQYDTSSINVYKNPTRDELIILLDKTAYKELRGFTDEQNNLYVWDSSRSGHGRVIKMLGFNEDFMYNWCYFKPHIDTKQMTIRCHYRNDYHKELERKYMESAVSEVTGKLRVTPKMYRNITDNKCQVYVTMHPMDFLKLTTSGNMIDMIKKRAQPLFRYNQYAKLGQSEEYRAFVTKLKGEEQDGVLVHPFLRIEIGSSDAFVTAHEGRHRSAALLAKGGTEMPVALCLRTTEHHPRDHELDITYALSYADLPYLVGSQYSLSTYVSTRNWKVVQDGMLKKYINESLDSDVMDVLTKAAKGSLLLPADIDIQQRSDGIEVHINSLKFIEDTLKRKFLFRAKGEDIRQKIYQSGGLFKKIGNMYHMTFTDLTNNFFIQRKSLLGHLAAGLGRTFQGVTIDIQGDRVSTDSDEVKYHHAYIRVFIPKRM